MRKIYLLALFVVTSFVASAQSADSTAKIGVGSQINLFSLSKFDETQFTSAEKNTITNYINTLSPRVKTHSFQGENLFVTLEPTQGILDLMEGIKVLGISLVYYNGKLMYFVNDDIKIETWNIK